MEAVLSLVALLVAILIGHLVLTLLWPLPRRGATGVVALALGTGIGFGVVSVLQFFIVWLAGVSGPVTFLVELTVLILLSLAVRQGRHRRAAFRRLDAANRRTTALRLAWPALLLASLITLFLFVRGTQQAPFGDIDAMSIWNMRAMFLMRSDGLAPPVFASTLAHTDYPLLLPLLVLRQWIYCGGENVMAPALVAATFTFSLLWLLVGAVVWRAGALAGVIAAVLFVGGGLLLRHGATQTADMPLALFLLAAVVALTVAEQSEVSARMRPMLVAGLCTGLAAWTKNEGLMFFVVIGSIVALRRLPIGTFLLGSAFALVAVVAFKLGFAPVTDLIRDQDGSLLSKIFDIERWQTILVAFLKQWILFRGDTGIGGPGMLWLVVTLFLVGRNHRPFPVAAAWVLLVLLLGYIAVFVLTPRPLQWHLVTAQGRVLLHLHPVAVFLFATTVRVGRLRVGPVP